jgi:hypothetical protein
MEYSFNSKCIVWEDNFDREYKGKIYKLDEFMKKVFMDQDKEAGHIVKIRFEDIVRVE